MGDYMQNNEGIVFNIQRYSIDDGPGIRTTVFLKGCPLNCLWCSNPESQVMGPELIYRYTSCKRCGSCIEACRNKALKMGPDGIVVDKAKCFLCGECVSACLYEAMQISGKAMTPEEVFRTVNKDAVYYRTSGGGCTCSGGEILCQPDFVSSLFKLCREAEIHTCADTSGYGSVEALEKIMDYTDLFYFDIKHMEPLAHKKGTGASNEIIVNNLRIVSASGIPITIRVPLIPGFNDSDDNLRAIAEAVREIVPRAEVDLLPYHRYGESKYRMLGRIYPFEGVPESTQAQKDHALEIMSSYGLNCRLSH